MLIPLNSRQIALDFTLKFLIFCLPGLEFSQWNPQLLTFFASKVEKKAGKAGMDWWCFVSTSVFCRQFVHLLTVAFVVCFLMLRRHKTHPASALLGFAAEASASDPYGQAISQAVQPSVTLEVRRPEMLLRLFSTFSSSGWNTTVDCSWTLWRRVITHQHTHTSSHSCLSWT